MVVVAALLCDFASVREGLLNVLSGGITRLRRAEMPAPLNVSVALMIELHETETAAPHELQVLVQDADGGRIFEARGAFTVTLGAVGGAVMTGEGALVPVVVDLRPGAVTSYGAYAAEILVDGEHRRTLQFWVTPSPDELEG